jgi:hypothetical protein
MGRYLWEEITAYIIIKHLWGGLLYVLALDVPHSQQQEKQVELQGQKRKYQSFTNQPINPKTNYYCCDYFLIGQFIMRMGDPLPRSSVPKKKKE